MTKVQPVRGFSLAFRLCEVVLLGHVKAVVVNWFDVTTSSQDDYLKNVRLNFERRFQRLTLVDVVLWQLAHLTVDHTRVIPEKSLLAWCELRKTKTMLFKTTENTIFSGRGKRCIYEHYQWVQWGCVALCVFNAHLPMGAKGRDQVWLPW